MAFKEQFFLQVQKSSGDPGYPGGLLEPYGKVRAEDGQWTALDRKEEFRQVFQVTGGYAEKQAIDLRLYAGHKKSGDQPIMILNGFFMNDRPRSSGPVFCDRDPKNSYHFLTYTYFWRIVPVKDMTNDEKVHEIHLIMSELLGPALRKKGLEFVQLGPLAVGVLLAALLACPLTIVARFACILLLGMGLKLLSHDLQILRDTQRTYQEKLRNAKNEDDLKAAAQASCDWWIALVEAILALGMIRSAFKTWNRPVSGPEAEKALSEAKAETAAEAKAAQAEAKSTPNKPPAPSANWKESYDYWLKESDRYAGEARYAEASGDAAAANQHYVKSVECAMEAAWAKEFALAMDGHGLVVESVGAWFSKNYLPKMFVRANKLIEMFAECGIELTQKEAALLVQDSAVLQPKGINFKGHDFSSPVGKNISFIVEGMKNPQPKLPPDLVKILKDPKTTPAERVAAIESNPQLNKHYNQGGNANVERAIRATESIEAHNTEPHHSPGNKKFDWFDINTWWEKGLDAAHSKIMKGRSYQKNIPLEKVEPFKNDPVRVSSVIKLGKFMMIQYLKSGGEYTRDQLINCSKLSEGKR